MNFRAVDAFHKKKKAVNKRILFPKDKNSDSKSQNEGFVKKTRFQYAEKLVLPAVISEKNRKKCFSIVEREVTL